MKKQARYGRQTIVRSERPTTKVGPEEVTVQRLLQREYAGTRLWENLTALVLPDLKKAVKMCKQVSWAELEGLLPTILENIMKELQREEKEYRRMAVDASIGSKNQVTVIPKAVDLGREAA